MIYVDGWNLNSPSMPIICFWLKNIIINLTHIRYCIHTIFLYTKNSKYLRINMKGILFIFFFVACLVLFSWFLWQILVRDDCEGWLLYTGIRSRTSPFQEKYFCPWINNNISNKHSTVFQSWTPFIALREAKYQPQANIQPSIKWANCNSVLIFGFFLSWSVSFNLNHPL